MLSHQIKKCRYNRFSLVNWFERRPSVQFYYGGEHVSEADIQFQVLDMEH